jgi:peptide chain release factor 1
MTTILPQRFTRPPPHRQAAWRAIRVRPFPEPVPLSPVRLPQSKLDQVLDRFHQVEARMGAATDGQEIVRLSKEHAEMKPVADAVTALARARAEIEDLRLMADDPEMAAMAEEELRTLSERLPDMERDVALLLAPRDADENASAVLEVRAGTGGDEAALFAGDLFRMYSRYASTRGWRVEIDSATEGEVGGYKEIIATVTGEGVFGRLKFESGVHRVQRVPTTEAGGRIHTSAATVAVLPEVEDVEIDIQDKDIRIDTYRASGSGGQHVNKTDSAVRITHLPTGIVVTSSEKSQHVNRDKAMKNLRVRLYDLQRQEKDQARSDARKSQVGSGDRSERIRTYNFPQGRVSDHRINLTLHSLPQILEGDLDPLLDALIAEDQAARLADLEAEFA